MASTRRRWSCPDAGRRRRAAAVAGQIDQALVPDITILVRMDAANQQPADYYLLADHGHRGPGCCCARPTAFIWIPTSSTRSDYFTTMAKRRKIEVQHERQHDLRIQHDSNRPDYRS